MIFNQESLVFSCDIYFVSNGPASHPNNDKPHFPTVLLYSGSYMAHFKTKRFMLQTSFAATKLEI